MNKKETVAVATESKKPEFVSTEEQDKDNISFPDSQDFGDMPTDIFIGKPTNICDSFIEDLGRDIKKAENTTNVGILELKKANQWMDDASAKPDPVSLFHGLWYEGEVCCLFADTNQGKSVLAVQIAVEIARKRETRKVLYLDCELSDKQFEARYKDTESGTRFIFPDNLYRAQIRRYCGSGASSDAISFEESLIRDIEAAALKTKADVIIIDNLTYLCNQAEKGEAAGRIMQRLTDLKMKYGWSLLVIAHTPKRDLSRPITQNDLAGSKKVMNFLDSSFAIGRSTKGEAVRYIKQIKTRAGEMLYGSDNVIVCSLEKSGGFLQFVEQCFDREYNHLRTIDEGEKDSREAKVMDLHRSGLSCREISKCVGYCSPATVSRIINKQKETDGVPSVSRIQTRNSETSETLETLETPFCEPNDDGGLLL